MPAVMPRLDDWDLAANRPPRREGVPMALRTGMKGETIGRKSIRSCIGFVWVRFGLLRENELKRGLSGRIERGLELRVQGISRCL